jgi:16S rRNA (guanine1207-N2)-methyltransferase
LSPQHYFSSSPASPHRHGTVRVVLDGIYLELATDSGTFSPGRLDPGTRLLLDEAPRPSPDGDLLDLGCGYGPMTCVMALRSPWATVWGLDVNERALALTAANAGRAGLRNVRTATPGDPSVPLRFATIWSNPPIRIGKQALHGLLRMWLARLAPGGQACLVVNRNLGADSLHRWLEGEAWHVTRRAARGGYRLLVVNDPERPGAGALWPARDHGSSARPT